MSVLRVVLCVCFGASGVHGVMNNCISWPSYVTPNDSTLCTCTYDDIFVTGYLIWNTSAGATVARGKTARGHASLPLSLGNVDVSEGGKPLTCFFVLVGPNAVRSMGSYTPFFAYGPDNVTMVSTKTYIPEDGSNMTLTCLAKVNPQPRFQWQGQPLGAVVVPGCPCGNGTFSETLTFDPRGYKDGDVIRCHVTNSVAKWPVSLSARFMLRLDHSKPVTVTMQQHVAVTVTLAILLMTSLLLLYLQWRKNQNYGAVGRHDETERKQTAERSQRVAWRGGERQPLLDSGSSILSGSSDEGCFLHPANPSVQSGDE